MNRVQFGTVHRGLEFAYLHALYYNLFHYLPCDSGTVDSSMSRGCCTLGLVHWLVQRIGFINLSARVDYFSLLEYY